MTVAASATPTSPTPPVARAVALLGLDGQGKPHGAAFGAADAELARKAAGLAGLHVLDLDGNDELRGLADKLPVGRIFASGAAFTPFVARKLFERLCFVGGVTPDSLAKLRAANAAARVTDQADPMPEHHLPAEWGTIRVGSLVLATGGGTPGEGWFEAVVTGPAEDSDVFVLRWRDWPDLEPFARHRDQLALLPRNAAVEG